ncbi:MAG: hypothetical protein ACI828_001541 [Flavobacteriales bacterium]|jgi:hypothetical protein
MRLAKTTSMLLLCLQVGYAQENTQEVATTMLTMETLITHAADQFPATNPQQIYVLVETEEEGISTDARFYFEQGMRLLLKRLASTDIVAIGTYGYDNQTLLDFTEVSDTQTILASMTQLYAMEMTDNQSDGIDLAYQYANENFEVDYDNKVLILRNDSSAAHKKIAKSSRSKKQKDVSAEAVNIAPKTKLGGAIALTALSILPEILDIIKN